MRTIILVCIFGITVGAATLLAQSSLKPAPAPASKVDFDAFETLMKEVKGHRKSRLVDWEAFKKLSTQEDVVILDTRSAVMYNQKHVKGAINLPFTEFTQARLAEVLPSPNTKILIYCNNNFSYPELSIDAEVFATKSFVPPAARTAPRQKELTLALNIPTYINLYGYGYKNVYELSELMFVLDPRVEFEGTSVTPLKK